MGVEGGGGCAREFIPFGTLDYIVENENGAVVGGFEDQNVLVFGLFVVQDLVYFEGHGLPRPHVGDFTKPAILDL